MILRRGRVLVHGLAAGWIDERDDGSMLSPTTRAIYAAKIALAPAYDLVAARMLVSNSF